MNPIKRLLQSVAERASRRTLERLAESSLADEIAYRAASESLRDGDTPRERFRGISDGFWFWLLTEGCRRNVNLRDFLPAMPEEAVQLRFTGDAGDVTLREGFNAYRLFRELYDKHATRMSAGTSVLDYGCGWGRIIRFFLKEIAPANLVGADPDRDVLAIAKATNRWCRFEAIPFTPPSSLPAASFDLIYSFSVFSHLSEERHRLVRDDLARLLKPGGLMMVTTRTRGFIDYCASLRADTDYAKSKPGHTSSAVAFPDTPAAKRTYDAGEYCHHNFQQGGEWDHWGETALSKKYVEREWTNGLQFVDFIDDPARLAQAVIVMRKL